jgi:hypothetical protein
MSTELERRRAVVVGVSQYPDGGWSDLRYPGSDASRLARVLVERCDFRPEDVVLFCDSPGGGALTKPRAPSFSDIMSAIQTMSDSAEAGDTLLFFFAGHGNEMSTEHYLLTNDTRQNVIRDTSLSVPRIQQMLDASKARCTVRLFDACRNPTPGERGAQAVRAMTKSFQSALLSVATGSIALSACSSGEFAYEHPDLGHGIFSFYLCQGLDGLAADQGGEVTFEGLVSYIKTSVANECKKRGFQQTPQFAGHLAGSLVLVRQVPAAMPKSPSAPRTPAERLIRSLADSLATRDGFLLKAGVTNADQFSGVCKRVFTAAQVEIKKLQDGYFSVAESGVYLLHIGRDGFSYKLLVKHARESGCEAILDEQSVSAKRFGLSSAHAFVPGCNLVIAVARFSYFYWIWMRAAPVPHDDSVEGALKPSGVCDHRTVLPDDAQDDAQVTGAVHFLLSRLADAVISWHAQCADDIGTHLRREKHEGKLHTAAPELAEPEAGL